VYARLHPDYGVIFLTRRETVAEQTAEKAHQTPREAAAAAKQTLERSGESAQRISETATRGYEEFLTLSRENMAGMARASQAMLNGTTELNSVWTLFWSEQLADGMEAMRSLAECRSWQEALTVQNEFARASLQRVCSRASKSVEVTGEMASGSFKPLQECAHKAIERFPHAAA
jgi:hypothetical protein